MNAADDYKAAIANARLDFVTALTDADLGWQLAIAQADKDFTLASVRNLAAYREDAAASDADYRADMSDAEAGYSADTIAAEAEWLYDREAINSQGSVDDALAAPQWCRSCGRFRNMHFSSMLGPKPNRIGPTLKLRVFPSRGRSGKDGCPQCFPSEDQSKPKQVTDVENRSESHAWLPL
ncbi:MAG: hypothetical protein AB7I37_22440 [Pirellulales bacterium]